MTKETKSGSYFTDYHYGSEDIGKFFELTQVEQIEATVKKWVNL